MAQVQERQRDADGFLYQLGETLMHKTKEGEHKYREDVAVSFFIVERVRQQCHGGYQQTYACRCYHKGDNFMGHDSISTSLVSIVENELCQLPPPKPLKEVRSNADAA